MIKCSTCGRESPDSAGQCVVCSTPLPGLGATTAVLTPPGISERDIETRMAPPSAHPFAPRAPSVLTPGQTFGNRYQVISLLGAGGMGAVYHVWDVELGMSLALKVIRPDTDPSSVHELERRFKRELVLARQVTHPNVIRIHDLGEIDGVKFLTMPFVQGTDLAHLLAKEGKLPVPRALAIARQIASGLKAAHEVGVVHRDLKPANILVDNAEHTQITDFGIARSTGGATLATAAGAIMGTLAYMAPEQATGRPVDQRADVYAFGLIFYEMITGRPAASGSGESALAVLMERSRHAPPPLRTVDPSVPEPIDRIVGRCLVPQPEGRYQNAAELEAELDKLDAGGHAKIAPAPPRRLAPIAAAVVLGLAIVAGAVWMTTRPSAPPAPVAAPAPVSVLVADFDNQAKDPVFQGSLEQVLSLAIEGASFITAYPRATAQGIAQGLRKGSTLNEEMAILVATSEDIKVVFTGQIASDGPGYRLTVRAIDKDGKELAKAEERVSDKAGVLRGVERAASTLRNDLGDTTPESARQPVIETVTAASLEALRSYARAQDLSTSGRAEESIPHYAEAIKHDSEFGRAYAGWAAALFNVGRSDEAAAKWAEATRRMDRMTEREKLRTLGGYFLGPGASYEQAIGSFEELVAKYPADRAGHINLAIAYFQTLQFAKAMEEAGKAAEIYPNNTRARSNYALIAMYASSFDNAQREAAKAIPAQYKAYLPIAAAAFVASNRDAMRQAYAQMREQGGTAGASLAAHGLADLAAYEGHWSTAIEALKMGIDANDAAKNTGGKAAKLAMLAEVYLSAGEAARAAATARESIALLRDNSTLVPAALVLLRAGRPAEAKQIADDLAQHVQPRNRAYAEIIEGEIARATGTPVKLREARDHFDRARKFADVWLARYFLGVIDVELERYPQADDVLRNCFNRRGEAMALFFDDVPTFRLLAPLDYWIARAQDGLGNKSAADGYTRFLSLRPESPRDPLVLDATKRLEALK